jgi:FKBP-type peptidyl-prolyl cis-trans isomerase FkpA
MLGRLARKGGVMKRLAATAFLLGVGFSVDGCQAKQPAPTPEAVVAPQTEEEKTLYALGAMLGTRFVQPLRLTPADLQIVQKGLGDTALGGQSALTLDEWAPKVEALARARAEAAATGEKERARSFLETAAKEQGSVKTGSGLVFRTLKAGSGKSPRATDVVRVHYHGTLLDGTVFDSSRQRGQPAEFPLNGVIPCWTEGVQRMKVGETARLVCPSEIAYGDRGAPPTIPGGATLVFEVELLAIGAGR